MIGQVPASLAHRPTGRVVDDPARHLSALSSVTQTTAKMFADCSADLVSLPTNRLLSFKCHEILSLKNVLRGIFRRRYRPVTTFKLHVSRRRFSSVGGPTLHLIRLDPKGLK